jgi:hypothetical protein
MEVNLCVVERHFDTSLAVLGVVVVALVPVLVTYSGLFRNGAHHTSFCRNKGGWMEIRAVSTIEVGAE